jgi:hypothetical protein
MSDQIVHAYCAPFVALCGARAPITVHADFARVTCAECKASEAIGDLTTEIRDEGHAMTEAIRRAAGMPEGDS